MADQKLTALTADTSPTTDDLLYVVNDPSGTPGSRKVTIANVLALSSGDAMEGVLQNGKISVTVASNNITLAIKTAAGSNPTSTDKVTVKINGTKREITAALSVTVNAAANTFNSGGTELATKEIDYFAYVSWRAASSAVVLGFARFPSARLYSDFSGTATNEKYAAFSTAPASTDDVVVCARFAATLSAGAGYTWTVPTYTNINLVQRPIWETRWLDWTPVWTGLNSMTVTSVTVAIASYKIVMDTIKYQIRVTAFTIGGTPDVAIINTLPFEAVNDIQLTGAMLSADSGSTAFGGNRINAATPDTLWWIKYSAANWAAGAGSVLNANGFYEA